MSLHQMILAINNLHWFLNTHTNINTMACTGDGWAEGPTIHTHPEHRATYVVVRWKHNVILAVLVWNFGWPRLIASLILQAESKTIVKATSLTGNKRLKRLVCVRGNRWMLVSIHGDTLLPWLTLRWLCCGASTGTRLHGNHSVSSGWLGCAYKI